MFGKTVVITGAGSSVDFGLPSGEGILRDLQDYERAKWKYARGEDEPNFEQSLENFDILMSVMSPSIHNQFAAFHSAVRGSSVPSIDLFADHRNEFVDLAKLWTVRCLFQKMPEAEEVCRRPRISTKRGNSLNWIAGASRLYYDGVSRLDDLDPDSMAFVTFNYDQLIEIGLRSFLENSFPTIADRKLLPPVLHVHGKFNKLPPRHNVHDIADQARGIRFVQESQRESDLVPELGHIRHVLESADRIFCLGFAFNQLNCDLLNLDQHAHKTFALNYDGSAGVEIAMRNLGIPKENIMKGSASNPISVGDAMDRGFFLLGD